MIVFRYFKFDLFLVFLLNLGILFFIEFKDGENYEFFGEYVLGFKVFLYLELIEGFKVNYFVMFRGLCVLIVIGFRVGVLFDGFLLLK